MLLAQGGSCIYQEVYSTHRLLNFGPRSKALTPWSSPTPGDCHLKPGCEAHTQRLTDFGGDSVSKPIAPP